MSSKYLGRYNPISDGHDRQSGFDNFLSTSTNPLGETEDDETRTDLSHTRRGTWTTVKSFLHRKTQGAVSWMRQSIETLGSVLDINREELEKVLNPSEWECDFASGVEENSTSCMEVTQVRQGGFLKSAVNPADASARTTGWELGGVGVSNLVKRTSEAKKEWDI
ncbi:hypothetical protein I302_107876 [Kwoniella bestiolae CBS 10118]|uniref:Uncharacterized protein n=1 Tax=Kwoniella bestiolae CBS 10118 TaxID=1296100 RepID=A0A1B9FXA2_9TREE|nr:hypothetical protein I302_06382 [Kwoniella bestiolae CBS 10118]OCF23401.1 hypothetical protein I302_06382 [Kwoniella bestiolae CBS 10118]